MKSRIIKTLILSIIVISLGAFIIVAEAAFNEQINYQGKLTDSNNVAVSDGLKCLKFRLMDADTGGSEVWAEQWHAATSKATTTSGLFSVMLGTYQSLSGVNFNQTLYLEVQYDPGCDDTYEEVFSPRKILGAVPAAFEAKKLSGKLESEFADLSENETISGAWTFNNILSVTATSTLATTTITDLTVTLLNYASTTNWDTAHHIVNASSTNWDTAHHIVNASSTNWDTAYSWGNYASDLRWIINGTDMYATNTVSQVGIGTTTPATNLHVWSTGGNAARFNFYNDQNLFLQFTENYGPMIDFSRNSSASLKFRSSVDGSTFTERMIIENDGDIFMAYNGGNVGIGTAPATSLLELYDTDASTQLTITLATDTTSYDPQIVFRTGGTPTTKFSLGVDFSDSNKLKIATSTIGTDDVLTINQSGSVGVGTTTPAYTLDIEGTLGTTGSTTIGTYTLTNVTSTTGYVLKLNSDGTATWQSDTTGGGADTDWIISSGDMTATDTIDYLINTNSSTTLATTTITDLTVTLLNYASTTNWDTAHHIVNASSTNWDTAHHIVNASSTNWDTAYSWGNYASDLRWIINGTDMYSTTTVTQVGIGTTTPASTFQVYGTSTFTGGSVGIGTTGPEAKLHVNGGIGISGSNSVDPTFGSQRTIQLNTQTGIYGGTDDDHTGALIWTTLNSGWVSRLKVALATGWDTYDTTNTAFVVGQNESSFTGNLGIGTSTPAFGLEVNASSSNGYFGVTSHSANSGQLFIIDESGNVGIGTTDPNAKLEVKDMALVSKSDTIPGSNSNVRILINSVISSDSGGHDHGSIAWVGHNRDIGANLAAEIGSGATSWDDAGYLVFKTAAGYGNPEERMRITEAGNIGIGTSTPASTFQVYGTSTFMGGNVGIGTVNPNELLTVEGVLSLKETTAPASITDYGKLYVKSSDSELYFLDEEGIETLISSPKQLIGSFTVATGTSVTAGDVVIFDNGYIEKAPLSRDELGPVAEFNGGIINNLYASDLDSDTFVVAYDDDGSEKAIIGVVSATSSISYGSEASMNNDTVAGLNATSFVTAYGGTTGKSQIGVVSGTSTISKGSEYTFYSATNVGNLMSVAKISSTKFVIAFNAAGGIEGRAIIGEVSGTSTISYGTSVVFSGDTDEISVSVLDSDHFVIAYEDAGESQNGRAIIGEISGTSTISFGTEYEFNAADIDMVSVAGLDSDHFVIAYEDVGNSNYGNSIIGEVSGTSTISFGTEYGFNSAPTNYPSVSVFNSNYFVVAYEDDASTDDGTVIIGEVSGTSTISYGSERVFYSSDGVSWTSVATLDSNSFVTAFKEDSGNDGQAVVGSNVFLPIVGIAKQSKSAYESCKVIISGISDVQSGLATGSVYYLSSEIAGGVTTTETYHQIGLALSPSELMLNFSRKFDASDNTWGSIFGKSDIAENYYVSDFSIEPGDLVIIDEKSSIGHPLVSKSGKSYDSRLIGVVSEDPAMVLGNEELLPGLEARPIALTGRVPVKVSTENGFIKVGDYLTSSDIPGTAMKATEPGRVIGIALESLGEGISNDQIQMSNQCQNPNKQNSTSTNSTSTDYSTSTYNSTPADFGTCNPEFENYLPAPNGASSSVMKQTGKVMVFVNPHWNIGEFSEKGSFIIAASTATSTDATTTWQVSDNTSILDRFTLAIKNSLKKLGLFIENGIAQIKEIITEKITTKKIQVEKIEMVDQNSGEIYCTWLENGEWVKVQGECEEFAATSTAATSTDLISTSTDLTATSTDLKPVSSTYLETFIDSHPAPETGSDEAYFTFSSSDQYAVFQCKLNSGDWEICASPKTYSGLIPGEYRFQVFSIDAYGNSDISPAIWLWTIIEATDETDDNSENEQSLAGDEPSADEEEEGEKEGESTPADSADGEEDCVPKDEVCDGIDNDCDGLIDEELVQECGMSDVGVCQFGVQTCSMGVWEACIGAIVPIEELCQDRIDNNCDGQIDESCDSEETDSESESESEPEN